MTQQTRPREVLVYAHPDGKEPFWEWLDGLRNLQAQTNIEHRIKRLEHGLLGDCDSIGDSVFELRVHVGPGYRIYFAEFGGNTILLLTGGTKKTQTKDIQQAKHLWRLWRQEKN